MSGYDCRNKYIFSFPRNTLDMPKTCLLTENELSVSSLSKVRAQREHIDSRFRSCNFDLDPIILLYTNLTWRFWRYQKVNFLGQDFQSWQTCRHAQTLPHAFAGRMQDVLEKRWTQHSAVALLTTSSFAVAVLTLLYIVSIRGWKNTGQAQSGKIANGFFKIQPAIL